MSNRNSIIETVLNMQTLRRLFHDNMELHRVEVLKYLRDKTQDVNERWGVFVLLPEDFYINTSWCGNEMIDSPYEDCCLLEGEQKSVKEIYDNYEQKFLHSEEQRDKLKEIFLQAGHTMIVYSW